MVSLASAVEEAVIVADSAIKVASQKVESEEGYEMFVGIESARAKMMQQAEKVQSEQAEAAKKSGMTSLMEVTSGMTMAQRLEDMSSLITQDSATGKSGAELIQDLSADDKDQLAELQKTITRMSLSLLETLGTAFPGVPSAGGEAATDEKMIDDGLKAVQDAMGPFHDQMATTKDKFPALTPFMAPLAKLTEVFTATQLKAVYKSPLEDFQKYKTKFTAYKQEHQEQILDFLKAAQFDDILTVLTADQFAAK